MKNRSVIIETTNRCNFNCSFCMVGEECGKEIIDFEQLIKWLKIKQKEYKLERIVLSGGEPFLSGVENLKKICREFPDTLVQIQTNGSQIDKFIEFKEFQNVQFGTSFQFGEYRKDSKVYNEDRFNKFQEKYYKIFGKYCFFIYVLTNDNYDKKIIDKLAKLVRKYNVSFHLSATMKMHNAKNCYIEYWKLIDIFIYLLKKYPDVALKCQPIRTMIMNSINHGSCPWISDCKDTQWHIGIDGKVYPCTNHFDNRMVEIGSIYE